MSNNGLFTRCILAIMHCLSALPSPTLEDDRSKGALARLVTLDGKTFNLSTDQPAQSVSLLRYERGLFHHYMTSLADGLIVHKHIPA